MIPLSETIIVALLGDTLGGIECDDFQTKTHDRSYISACCRPNYADGWEYHMVQYIKDEYIKLMDEANQKAQADLEYLAMMTEVELE